MLRWLLRLLVLGAILGAVAFVAQRLLNQEDDWDDFDDLDESFEFQETPVEIEVPAEESSESASGSGAEGEGSEGTSEEGSGLIDIKGIGPAIETRLNAIGINTLQDLMDANPESLNEQLEPRVGVSSIEDWIAQAKDLASGGSSSNGRADR